MNKKATVGIVVVVALAGVMFMLFSRSSGPTVSSKKEPVVPVVQKPVQPEIPVVPVKAVEQIKEVKAALAVVEKQQGVLEQKIAEVDRSVLRAREAAARSPDVAALKAEVAAVQKELDEAVMKHPSVVEKLNQIARLESEWHQATTNLSTLIESNTLARSEFIKKKDAVVQNWSDREMAELTAVMAKFGKKPYDKNFSPEERNAYESVRSKYNAEMLEIRAARAAADKEFEAGQKVYEEKFNALSEVYIAPLRKKEAVQNEIQALRPKIIAGDPSVAAINKRFYEKSMMLQSRIGASPEANAALKDLNKLGAEYSELAAQSQELGSRLEALEKETVGAGQSASKL